MALTQNQKALVEAILKTLREEPALLEELRRLLVPEIVVFLPDLKVIAERQVAIEERLSRELSVVWDAINALRTEVAELRQDVRSISERQERMERQVERIERRQEQTGYRLERMDQRQEQIEHRQDRMEQRLQRVEVDVGAIKGKVEEINYRIHFLGYFGFWVLSAEDPWRRLWEQLEKALAQNRITEDEFNELRDADLLWLGVLRRGKFAGHEVLIGAELSWTVHCKDVERVLRRAEVARKAGFWVVPLVAGDEWESPELKSEAIAKGVICVENGRVTPLEWDEILALWRPNISEE